ncbi:prolipoprotein diacylglyceryl transferase [Candidatus Roizmanbacteria bacterium]|nr:prolipoprotein diacylglyceryl transferase [Candidatus Roizmanbacteria bacterium]
MLPVLLDLKFIKIYTFGVFLVLAFFWGSFLLWKNIRLTVYKEEELFDGLFLSIAGALFFGRITYVALNFSKFGFSVLKFILINGYPGMSLVGAVFGGFLTLYLYFLSKKINFIEAADYFIGPLFIALGFGKLGSFFAGSEVGEKTKFFLSIKYSGFDGLRHLTPFYEAMLFFFAAFIAHKLMFDVRRERRPRGFVFFFFLWFFNLVYFLFDKLKGNKLYFMGQSFNSLVGLVFVLTFSFYFLYYFRSLVLDYVKSTISKIRERARKSALSRKEKDRKTD